MKKYYTIGVDFGTLTARGVLVDVSNGEEKAVSIFGYQDAVIDRTLPEYNTALPSEYALQNPEDYEAALEGILKDLWRKAEIDPACVVGIGIDFTSCTVIPLDEGMMPLCMNPAFRGNKHSWPKLWKHHSAQKQANRINEVARRRGETFIKRYGGTSSCEWLFAKVLEILEEAPDVYAATYRFVEAADWIFYLLTGELKKSSVPAGFKAFWSKDEGYPSREFFKELDPALENVIEEKIGTEVFSIGTYAGRLSRRMSEITGLPEGISVALGNIDAHSSFPAAGATEDSSMLMIMGTSLCHILISSKEVFIDGISGVVRDGVMPGYYGYEAGQAAVGDIYDWFVSNLLPSEFLDEVKRRNINVFDLINEKMALIKPGASGLLALDWWNGNRSLLVNSDLSGLVLGMTLTTAPEEVYRALVEATAFGSRMIIEEFVRRGVPVNRIYACGGLSIKSPEIMQIFADILGKPVIISNAKQTSALGAAIYGAAAAGRQRGGYDSVFEAVERMVSPSEAVYVPNKSNEDVYNKLYEQYVLLHDFFGRGGSDVMQTLKHIKNSCTAAD